jgi:hypothetical protein
VVETTRTIRSQAALPISRTPNPGMVPIVFKKQLFFTKLRQEIGNSFFSALQAYYHLFQYKRHAEIC